MFEMPESLEGLSADELNAHLAAVRDEAAPLYAAMQDPATADSVDLTRLEALADFVDTLETALGAHNAAVTARNEQAARLQARLAGALAPHVDEEAEIVAAADKKAKKAKKAEAVVAAANMGRLDPSKVVANAPKAVIVDATPEREVQIVAAAGLPGIQGGSVVTMDDLVKPAIKRWESYQDVPYAKDQLFSLKSTGRDSRLIVGNGNAQDVMTYASDQGRLRRLPDARPKAQGIVASGGWCAPAEQRFDVCTLACLDGILDVPTIAMPRGSISYFRQLDYAASALALAAGEFCFTNAQLVADPPVVKPCFEIPCATPVQATLDVCGLCIRAGLLQQKAFPELIAAWMHIALIAFAHFLNARNIAQMVAGSGPVIAMPGTFGAISAFVDAVYLQATVYRAQNGMCMDAPLEVVAPYWLPEIFAIDEERRQFQCGADDDWRQDLADANIRVQYVKDYQDTVFTAASPVTSWPTSVEFLMFAPGAWVRGSEDIISVSTLVDSTLLSTNRVQLLFIETATVMLPWCGPSVRVSVPLCPSGATAGPIASTPGVYTCSE